MVLSTALEKLALVGTINIDPTAQAQALTQSVGDEISRMISEQQQLEGRFEELVAAQRVLRAQPNKAKLQENEVRGVLVVRGFACEGVEGRTMRRLEREGGASQS